MVKNKKISIVLGSGIILVHMTLLIYTMILFMDNKQLATENNKLIMYAIELKMNFMQKDRDISELTKEITSIREYFGYQKYGVYYEFKDNTNVPDGLPVTNEWFWVSSLMGTRKHPFNPNFYQNHNGMDFITVPLSEAFATGDGVIKSTSYDPIKGRTVVIKHKHGFETYYSHLDNYYYRVGRTVKKGSPIGRIGTSGKVTGRHLHYEIRYKGAPINPMIFIKQYLDRGNRVFLTDTNYVTFNDAKMDRITLDIADINSIGVIEDDTAIAIGGN